MEFTAEGGVFMVELKNRGVWEVRVPWQVAIDGLLREGRKTTDRQELSGWLEKRTTLFREMIAARLNGRRSPHVSDDPRIEISRLGPNHAAARLR